MKTIMINLKQLNWWSLAIELILLAYIGFDLFLAMQILAPEKQQAPILLELIIEQRWSVQLANGDTPEQVFPAGLAVDKTGNVYVAVRGNKQVQKYTKNGILDAKWVGDDSGQHPFIVPIGIAINPVDQSIWVLDSGNGWIYQLGQDGKMTAVVEGANLGFYNPTGLAITDSGDLFIADTGGARIVHLDQQGNFIGQWGGLGILPGQLSNPSGIAIHDDKLFVVDSGNRRIAIFNFEGKWLGSWMINESSSWVATDTSGRVFVSGGPSRTISIYNADGNLLSVINQTQEEDLFGIATKPDGLFFVAGASHLKNYQINW